MKILIVGASSGLGSEILRCAEEREHQVLGTYNKSPSDKLIHCDVTDDRSTADAVSSALAALSGLDAVIYCSAIDRPNLVGQTKIADWQDVYDVNVLGAVRVTKALLPHFLRMERGTFQYISSGLATRSNFGTSAYAASKAALNAFARGVSKEYASKGVRSFTVMPGFIDCGFISYLSPPQRSRVETLIDLKRIAKPAEIAGFCVATLENSAYLTAAELEIHGGLA